MYTADALSHTPIMSSSSMQETEDSHTELFICAVVLSLPVSADRLQEYRMAQHADSDCKQLMDLCMQKKLAKVQKITYGKPSEVLAC